MRKRWMPNFNELLARLANPYRPERHYMRGGKSRELTARIGPRRNVRVDKDRRSIPSLPAGK